MGLLLFAARKIQLKREINNKNYELTQINDQIKDALKRTNAKQEELNRLKNNVSVFNQNMQQTMYNAGNLALQQAMQNGASAEQLNNMSIFNNNMTGMAVQIFSNLNEAAATNAQKLELAKLQNLDQELEMRKTNIETELEVLKNEYSSYDNAVKESAKSSAPQFGLA